MSPEARLAAAEAAIRALQAAVAELQEHHPSAAPLRLRERDALERILPAVAGVFGSDWFKSGEAAAKAEAQTALSGVSATRLGQLLSAAVGHVVAGLVVERSDGAGHARLWRLLEVAPQRGSRYGGGAPPS